jgi:hypothetical protein
MCVAQKYAYMYVRMSMCMYFIIFDLMPSVE